MIDGEKLRRLRQAKGYSQEKLAILCDVNKRTVQRAESNEPIALETAAFIAEAIGVTPVALRLVRDELLDEEKKAWNDVVLVPISSGRRIVDALRLSFDASISYDVEPTKANIDPLGTLASLLEPFAPDPWRPYYEQPEWSQAEVLTKQAEVNEVLPTLAEMGITVFLATYTAARQAPLYNMDEGHMYIPRNAQHEQQQIALVVISDTASSHLMRRPDDMYEEIPF